MFDDFMKNLTGIVDLKPSYKTWYHAVSIGSNPQGTLKNTCNRKNLLRR